MGKKSFLGVDIGAAGIKVVELGEAKGRPLLETYGFSERNPDEYAANLLDSPKETAQLLKGLVKQAGARSTKAIAGLPVASIFSSVITVPALAGKELAAAIEAQAKKFIILLRVIGLGRMRRWFAVKTTQQYLRNVNTKKGIKKAK